METLYLLLSLALVNTAASRPFYDDADVNNAKFLEAILYEKTETLKAAIALLSQLNLPLLCQSVAADPHAQFATVADLLHFATVVVQAQENITSGTEIPDLTTAKSTVPFERITSVFPKAVTETITEAMDHTMKPVFSEPQGKAGDIKRIDELHVQGKANGKLLSKQTVVISSVDSILGENGLEAASRVMKNKTKSSDSIKAKNSEPDSSGEDKNAEATTKISTRINPVSLSGDLAKDGTTHAIDQSEITKTTRTSNQATNYVTSDIISDVENLVPGNDMTQGPIRIDKTYEGRSDQRPSLPTPTLIADDETTPLHWLIRDKWPEIEKSTQELLKHQKITSEDLSRESVSVDSMNKTILVNASDDATNVTTSEDPTVEVTNRVTKSLHSHTTTIPRQVTGDTTMIILNTSSLHTNYSEMQDQTEDLNDTAAEVNPRKNKPQTSQGTPKTRMPGMTTAVTKSTTTTNPTKSTSTAKLTKTSTATKNNSKASLPPVAEFSTTSKTKTSTQTKSSTSLVQTSPVSSSSGGTSTPVTNNTRPTTKSLPTNKTTRKASTTEVRQSTTSASSTSTTNVGNINVTEVNSATTRLVTTQSTVKPTAKSKSTDVTRIFDMAKTASTTVGTSRVSTAGKPRNPYHTTPQARSSTAPQKSQHSTKSQTSTLSTTTGKRPETTRPQTQSSSIDYQSRTGTKDMKTGTVQDVEENVPLSTVDTRDNVGTGKTPTMSQKSTPVLTTTNANAVTTSAKTTTRKGTTNMTKAPSPRVKSTSTAATTSTTKVKATTPEVTTTTATTSTTKAKTTPRVKTTTTATITSTAKNISTTMRATTMRSTETTKRLTATKSLPLTTESKTTKQMSTISNDIKSQDGFSERKDFKRPWGFEIKQMPTLREKIVPVLKSKDSERTDIKENGNEILDNEDNNYVAPGQTGDDNFGFFTCPSIFGFYPDAINCGQFYICSWSIPYHFDCPVGTVWNIELTVCDWPFNVNCGSRPWFGRSSFEKHFLPHQL